MVDRVPVDHVGVHRTHCCVVHGCKYGNDDCPVANGTLTQEYLCEDCSTVGINSFEDLRAYTSGEETICPHCGHMVE